MLAVLGMVMQGVAQVTLEVPKFTKVLQVLSKGINVRAEPSTQSEKIANGPELLLVIDETPEWYHACIVKGETLLPKPGYVSKKVCRVKVPKAVTADYVRRAFGEHCLELVNKTSGKYRGWATMSYRYFNLGMERQYFFIGKPIGNTFVGKLFSYNSVDNQVVFYQEGVLGESVYTVSSGRLGGEYEENLSKLTDSDLDKLLSSGDKNYYAIVYADKVEFTYSNGAMEPPTTESGNGVQHVSFSIADFQGEKVMY